MKIFSLNNNIPKNRIETKAVYLVFLFFILTGAVAMFGIQVETIGLTTEKIASHYLGSESEEEMTFPLSLSQMLQQTHFHAFGTGIMAFILTHLLISAAINDILRRILIFTILSVSIINLILPWLIRYASGSFSIAAVITWPVFTLSYTASTVMLIYDFLRK